MGSGRISCKTPICRASERFSAPHYARHVILTCVCESPCFYVRSVFERVVGTSLGLYWSDRTTHFTLPLLLDRGVLANASENRNQLCYLDIVKNAFDTARAYIRER
jgi:hypothetical protein